MVQLPNGQFLLTKRVAGVPFAMLPRARPAPDLGANLQAVGWHRRPLILSPETPCPLPASLPLAKSRLRAVLDLAAGQDICRARLHGKWRNQLRRAEGAGLHVTARPLRPRKDRELFTLENAQRQARGYAGWPIALTTAFAEIAPHQTLLLSALRDGRPVAHMLFLLHGSGMTYHMGHISTEGRAVCAHNLLLWEAIRRGIRKGCISLDLGELDARTPGLTRFKLRSGAQPIRTGGTWLFWRPWMR